MRIPSEVHRSQQELDGSLHDVNTADARCKYKRDR